MENLLFIDDDLSILHTLKLVMQGEGYKMHFANDASSAKQVLKNHDIAVIVADKNLPGKSGLEILEEAKEISPRSVRVMISGESDLQSTLKCINIAEVYRYVTKPFSGTSIREIINKAVKKFQATPHTERENSNQVLNYKKLLIAKEKLKPGMKLCDDLKTDNGVLIARNGHTFSFHDIKAINSYHISKELKVLYPS